MTGWAYLILAGALFLGLKTSMTARYRYLAVCTLVVIAVSYAAVRQHAY
jgi:hypothetical protein